MTWAEFKGLVDQRLAEEGWDDSVEIFYFDTGNYPLWNLLRVAISDDGVEVSSS